MNRKLLTCILLILSACICPAQDQLYIWTEIHPGWKKNSLEFWSHVKGFGKTVPREMSAMIEGVDVAGEKKLKLSLKQAFLLADLSKDPVIVSDPVSVGLTKNDMFLDLQCKIVKVSETYPYFRTSKIRIQPKVQYKMVLYGPGGDILLQREYIDSIDYKHDIRPLLRGMPEQRRDVEIVRHTFLNSFSGPLPIRIIDELGQFLATTDPMTMENDPEKFREVIQILFEDRKINYPEAYQSVNFNKLEPQAGAKPATSSPVASGEDILLSGELGSLLDESRYFALLIGINSYDDSGINDLTEPIRDVKRLMSTLSENYTFDRKNIQVLENPTRDDLVHSLDQFAYELTEKDNLLIFYAGHGIWDEQLEKGFWIPSNASPDNRAKWFSNSDLRDYIGGIKAKHTLLISDACFSGGIFKTRDVKVFSNVAPATIELYKLPSRKAMTSGTMTTVPDHSIFIEYLIDRLTANNNPVLSSEQLFASFKIAVINNSPTKQVPQFGEIRETGDEGGDFLFIRKNK